MAAIGRPRVDPVQRFNSRVVRQDNGCLTWTGFLDPDGYGQFGPGGRSGSVRAHRWAYEYHVGPIPAGLVIDHLCRNRACVNYLHLEVVTPQENTRRGLAPTALNARKTSCKRGHPLSGPNLAPVPGGRSCRTCRVEATRQWRARQKKEAS